MALACRGAAPSPSPVPHAQRPAAAERRSGTSDDKLLAFVRWQREYTEVLGRQRAAIEDILPLQGRDRPGEVGGFT